MPGHGGIGPMTYDNRSEEYKFHLSIPRWCLWVLVALLGFGGGIGVAQLVVIADESNAYHRGQQAGYEDGRSTCGNPSRVKKASDWFFGPKG